MDRGRKIKLHNSEVPNLATILWSGATQSSVTQDCLIPKQDAETWRTGLEFALGRAALVHCMMSFVGESTCEQCNVT